MKRITLIFGLLLLVSLAVVAQIRGKEIVVQVQPNHANWNYRLGEEAIFNVAVLKNGCPLPSKICQYLLFKFMNLFSKNLLSLLFTYKKYSYRNYKIKPYCRI